MARTDEKRNEEVKNLGTWINKDFLEELLFNKLNEKVTVKTIKISAAVAVGENYMSVLYKTRATYTTQKSEWHQVCYLMIKGLPEGQIATTAALDLGVFDKETVFYSSLLPAMKKIIDNYFPSNIPLFAAEGYVTSRTNTVVMEDLSMDGYKVMNRLDKIDYDHCLTALRAMARMHAVSLKLNEEDPTILATACRKTFVEGSRSLMSTLLVGPTVLAGEMRNWSEFEDAEEKAELLLKVTPFLLEKLEVMEDATGKFKVMNHGDLWSNNIMYKHDDAGNVLSVKFVDYQMLKLSSPAMELQYFLNMSVQQNVLNDHLYEFLYLYFDALKSDMAAMGATLNYSLEQLHEDMRDYAVMGIVAISAFSTAVYAPMGEGVDLMPEEKNDQHPFTAIFQTERYKTFVMIALRLFEKVGYLEDANRLQYIENEMLQKERDTEPRERIASAHERHFVERIKSAAKGVYRRIINL